MAQEKTFENKIKKYLKGKGAYYVKYHGNAYSTNGTPDILACVNGYFLGIEVKAQMVSLIQRDYRLLSSGISETLEASHTLYILVAGKDLRLL